jgi:chemotaxis family two-component system sensor kinase Cph1
VTSDADEIERLRGEVERAGAELEQFAYRISHDLQEPLRTVTAFAGLLERRHADQLEGDAREFLDFVTDGARRMGEMVDGLLAFSRAGRFEVGEERVATAGLVEPELVEGELPEVRGSDEHLRQVFAQLIANARTFTAPGEAPVVRVSARREEGVVRFAVADQGIGVAPADAERIFEVFARLHTREAYPGLGVGLAVARRIVERHGGRIWVEPNEPRGAVFSFTIPA